MGWIRRRGRRRGSANAGAPFETPRRLLRASPFETLRVIRKNYQRRPNDPFDWAQGHGKRRDLTMKKGVLKSTGHHIARNAITYVSATAAALSLIGCWAFTAATGIEVPDLVKAAITSALVGLGAANTQNSDAK
jgi:hypothetical protein